MTWACFLAGVQECGITSSLQAPERADTFWATLFCFCICAMIALLRASSSADDERDDVFAFSTYVLIRRGFVMSAYPWQPYRHAAFPRNSNFAIYRKSCPGAWPSLLYQTTHGGRNLRKLLGRRSMPPVRMSQRDCHTYYSGSIYDIFLFSP